MKDDSINTTVQLYEILRKVLGVGGLCRIAECSVSEVYYKPDDSVDYNKTLIETRYYIGLYIGPFCTKGDIKKFVLKNPVPLCRRDAVQFVVKSLSDEQSPYFFNEKTGKFDYKMIPM